MGALGFLVLGRASHLSAAMPPCAMCFDFPRHSPFALGVFAVRYARYTSGLGFLWGFGRGIWHVSVALMVAFLGDCRHDCRESKLRRGSEVGQS